MTWCADAPFTRGLLARSPRLDLHTRKGSTPILVVTMDCCLSRIEDSLFDIAVHVPPIDAVDSSGQWQTSCEHGCPGLLAVNDSVATCRSSGVPDHVQVFHARCVWNPQGSL